MSERIKLLDPAALLGRGKPHLRARYVVEGIVSGLHKSPFTGHSLEFSQHREYTPLDEPKHIDWKVYGRTDKLFIKQYEEETNLRSYILLDKSGSMAFAAGGKMDKLTYSANIAAALSYLLIHQEDSVGLALFDTGIKEYIPPRAQSEQFSLIYNTLQGITPGGETSLAETINGFGRLLKKRSLLIFISDLMDEPSDVLKAIKQFRFKHHDVIVLHVIDPAERALDFGGSILFESLEKSGEKFYTEPDDIRAVYTSVFEKFLEDYRRGFLGAGIDYHLIVTDVPVEAGLGAYLAARGVRS
jgi:uncharacterized protein (DUF58 family)